MKGETERGICERRGWGSVFLTVNGWAVKGVYWGYSRPEYMFALRDE